jgi:hypothetical protein
LLKPTESEYISKEIEAELERNPHLSLNKDSSMDISGNLSALEKEISAPMTVFKSRAQSKVLENQASQQQPSNFANLNHLKPSSR